MWYAMDKMDIVLGAWQLSCLFYKILMFCPCSGLDNVICYQWTSTFDNVPRDQCYWYADLPTSMTAMQANDYCGNNGGTLAPYIDDQQYSVLQKVMDDWTGSITSTIWIGVNDIETDSVWLNWNGEPTSVQDKDGHGHWKSRQPSGERSDAYYPGQGDQDCVVVTPSSGDWEDKSCYQKHGGALCYKENAIPVDTGEIGTILSGLYRLEPGNSGVVFNGDQIFTVLVTRLTPCLMQCNIYNSCSSVVFVKETNLCYGYNRIFARTQLSRPESDAKYYYRV